MSSQSGREQAIVEAAIARAEASHRSLVYETNFNHKLILATIENNHKNYIDELKQILGFLTTEAKEHKATIDTSIEISDPNAAMQTIRKRATARKKTQGSGTTSPTTSTQPSHAAPESSSQRPKSPHASHLSATFARKNTQGSGATSPTTNTRPSLTVPESSSQRPKSPHGSHLSSTFARKNTQGSSTPSPTTNPQPSQTTPSRSSQKPKNPLDPRLWQREHPPGQ